jgi:hypothetical protein
VKQSIIQQRGPVAFPAFTGERAYMVPFTKSAGLPDSLARWQPTVDAMLDGVDTAGPIYIMIDQTLVRAGMPQRRPGVHIDGCWTDGGWDTAPGWVTRAGHKTHLTSGAGRQALILASDVQGGAAWVGEYDGEPGAGGDFSHLDLGGLQRVPMTPGCAWAGDAMTMLHASMTLARDTQRTLVRLNVTNWMPQ